MTESEQEHHSHHKPETIPPCPKAANYHWMAMRTAPTQDQDKLTSKQRDYETGKLCEKNVLPICCDVNDLKFLGCGYPLFFHYILFTIKFLLAQFVVVGIYNIITNLNGKTCESQESPDFNIDLDCLNNYATRMSLGNKSNDHQEMQISIYLNFVATFVLIVLFQFWRAKQRKTDVECDEAEISADDYTIEVKNIPKEIHEPYAKQEEFRKSGNKYDYDKDIQKFCERELCSLRDVQEEGLFKDDKNRKNLEVTQIILGYDLTKLEDLKYKKAEKIQLKQKYLKEHSEQVDENEKNLLDEEIALVDTEIKDFVKQFCEAKGTDFMKEYFTGYAFVSFATEQQKNLVLKKQGIQHCCSHLREYYGRAGNIKYHKQSLTIRQARPPDDIIWENLKYSERAILYRRILNGVVNLLLMIGCFYLLLQCSEYQHNATIKKEDGSDGESGNSKKQSQSYIDGELKKFLDINVDVAKAKSIALSISIFIYLLNWICKKFIYIFAQKIGKYTTETDQNIAIMRYLTLVMFFNTSVITFLVQVYQSNGNKIALLYGQGEVILNQNQMFITNTILPFLMESVNQYVWISRFWRCCARKDIKNNKCYLTQRQLNQLYEDPQFDVAYKYASITKTIYMTAMYAYPLPIVLVYSAVAMFLIYWVYKYNLIKRSTVKNQLTISLSQEATEMLEYALPIYAVSSMLFLKYAGTLDDQSHSIVNLTLIISVVHCFLPMERFNDRLLKCFDIWYDDEPTDEKWIDQDFQMNYGTSNPATQEKYVKMKHHPKPAQEMNIISASNIKMEDSSK